MANKIYRSSLIVKDLVRILNGTKRFSKIVPALRTVSLVLDAYSLIENSIETRREKDAGADESTTGTRKYATNYHGGGDQNSEEIS
jgi:hypothetical protein